MSTASDALSLEKWRAVVESAGERLSLEKWRAGHCPLSSAAYRVGRTSPLRT
jgi:hypothetical protein